LDYCTQKLGHKVPHPAACSYADKFELLPDGTQTSRMFLPTAEIVMTEKRNCKPSKKDKWKCDVLYDKVGKADDVYYLNESRLTYFANVEDYIVQLTSTYHRDAISGTSLKHPGYYWECQDEGKNKSRTWEERIATPEINVACEKWELRYIECKKGAGCKHENIIKEVAMLQEGEQLAAEYGSAGGRRLRSASSLKAMQHRTKPVSAVSLGVNKTGSAGHVVGHYHHVGDIQDEAYVPTPDVYASVWGDTFKLGKLLSLADADLDHHYNMDGYTTRQAGTILEIEIVFENMLKFLSSFGFSQVRYAYKVSEKKLPYISREWLANVQPADYPESRRYVVQHGVMVVFSISGEFGFFSIVYLLIMLTTSMALLATAHKITDLFSIYGHPRKMNYFHLKYEVSPDFSDMWECKTCGYFNQPSQTTCHGLPQWESAFDKELCGVARDQD